jgi:hypothetical protein
MQSKRKPQRQAFLSVWSLIPAALTLTDTVVSVILTVVRVYSEYWSVPGVLQSTVVGCTTVLEYCTLLLIFRRE